MKSKWKYILIILIIVIAVIAAMFTFRKEDEDIATQEEKKIRPTILVVEGACSPMIETLPDEYDVKICKTDDEVKSEVLKGNWSLAVLDAKKAGQLYLQSKKTITAISPIQIDGLQVMQKNYVERIINRRVKSEETGDMEIVEFVDLPKPNILLSNNIMINDYKGGVEEDIFNKFLETNDIKIHEERIEYATDLEEFQDVMQRHRQFGLATEPVATKIMSDDNTVKTVFDLSEWWQEETGYSVPIKVLIANNSFLKEHQQQAEKPLTP